MKKVFCSCLFLSVLFFANGQSGEIPADVTHAFMTRYPHATHVEWKDKLPYFEVSFQLNGSAITANFSSNGEWEGSERQLSFDQLPDEVKTGFQKCKYAGCQKKAVYEIQELGKPLQYRVSVHKPGMQKKILYFDVNGKLLKEVAAL